MEPDNIFDDTFLTSIFSHLVSRDSPEVGHSSHRVLELLHFVKVVGHGYGLPYLWLVPHDRVRVSGEMSADWRQNWGEAFLLNS